jgi:hypothetical protein
MYASNGEISQAAQTIYQAGSAAIATSSKHNDGAFVGKFHTRDSDDHLDLDLDYLDVQAPSDDVIIKALESLKQRKAPDTFGETTEGLGFMQQQGALCKLVKACFLYTLTDVFHQLAGLSFEPSSASLTVTFAQSTLVPPSTSSCPRP